MQVKIKVSIMPILSSNLLEQRNLWIILIKYNQNNIKLLQHTHCDLNIFQSISLSIAYMFLSNNDFYNLKKLLPTYYISHSFFFQIQKTNIWWPIINTFWKKTNIYIDAIIYSVKCIFWYFCCREIIYDFLLTII